MDQHNDALLAIGLFVLGGIFTVVWYFIKSKFNAYDKFHQTHFEHSANMIMHDTERERELEQVERRTIALQLKEHNDQDDRRFSRMEQFLDEIRADIKTLLRK